MATALPSSLGSGLARSLSAAVESPSDDSLRRAPHESVRLFVMDRPPSTATRRRTRMIAEPVLRTVQTVPSPRLSYHLADESRLNSRRPGLSNRVKRECGAVPVDVLRVADRRSCPLVNGSGSSIETRTGCVRRERRATEGAWFVSRAGARLQKWDGLAFTTAYPQCKVSSTTAELIGS
jgi:hypothetical protein